MGAAAFAKGSILSFSKKESQKKVILHQCADRGLTVLLWGLSSGRAIGKATAKVLRQNPGRENTKESAKLVWSCAISSAGTGVYGRGVRLKADLGSRILIRQGKRKDEHRREGLIRKPIVSTKGKERSRNSCRSKEGSSLSQNPANSTIRGSIDGAGLGMYN